MKNLIAFLILISTVAFWLLVLIGIPAIPAIVAALVLPPVFLAAQYCVQVALRTAIYTWSHAWHSVVRDWRLLWS